ncbi:stage II sporulation protein D [Virgibacillus sp. W0430]|uniref:stage II sporulation protein D n=1 Tax=Virgibacillus sp. W0430 TaxID=3391580 RepID=UPI003F455775
MKRNRYTLKKQIRKRRKTSMLKQFRNQKVKKSSTNAINNKRAATLRPFPSRWKVPAILFVAVLIIIIVIVPSLVVIPFIKQDNELTTIPTKNETPELSVEVESPFSVAVMRSVSDEIEDVPLETYVMRVVASEMPAEFEQEALKAQALAARTYIVNHLLHNDTNLDSDVTDTTKHQVYQNEAELKERWGNDFDWKMKKIKEAVYATSGQVLTYKDAPITPAFFSTSNGFTENSEDYWENELPYLRSVESEWDTASPKYLDQKVFTLQNLKTALQVPLPTSLPVEAHITRTASGRVAELQLGDNTLTGREVREKLGLQSSDFSIEQKNDHFVFKTKGYGHGVGMSQYGANGMAQEGKSYKEIVQYYYQGVEVSNVREIAPTLVAK